ncbi:hypothetical protein [Sphingomonas nostoxanthinifaciens]|uniref:hypothetical protein n=1 Tax=Sphingomonas nostoxanthinifaciens TaxID=2872652 RepID=UPI001CC1F58D|nr:hypothetical protein [Sphingomonas nostoxanthinifaciens]UAK25983.1 hypothetical protein K8P63_07680 [Sphingomonas nostoxanthinifaciens]
MSKVYRWAAALPVTAALLLGGCGEKTPTLSEDPIEQAASCGVIAAAAERQAAGIKGDLPVAAQERIFHYPLLAGSAGPSFDAAKADAVFKRMPKLFDTVVKGKWQTLQPTCATAFPATQIKTPTLPDAKLDGLLQCYVLVDFMRKALGGQGASYAEAANKYGVLGEKLDAKLSPALAKIGVKNGDALQAKRAEGLAAAAKLGPPPAVIDACEAKFG